MYVSIYMYARLRLGSDGLVDSSDGVLCGAQI